jgi:hypothetical protein
MIWPELDRWKGRFGLAPDQTNDLAAMGLTGLLFYLREVILQDSVFLMKQFPDSPAWNHPVFQHEAYGRFAQEVSALVQEEGERPSQLALLAQAVPALADYLQSVDSRNDTRMAGLRADITDLRADLKAGLKGVEHQAPQQQLQTLLLSGLTFQLKAAAPGALKLQPAPAPIAEEAQSQYASACSSISNSRSASPGLEKPPQYSMCRAVKTVKDLWREWTVGLRGQPAIDVLDRRWGSRWRSGRQSELQWYSLRLEIVKEIRRIARAQRTSEEVAVQAMSLRQQQLGCSIDQLCKLLRAGRKARLAAQKTVKVKK